jgi:hypothetical protein
VLLNEQLAPATVDRDPRRDNDETGAFLAVGLDLQHERELLLALAGLTGLPEERAAVAELLTAAPGLCLLGAAAQPLGFAGERVFALGDA